MPAVADVDHKSGVFVIQAQILSPMLLVRVVMRPACVEPNGPVRLVLLRLHSPMMCSVRAGRANTIVASRFHPGLWALLHTA